MEDYKEKIALNEKELKMLVSYKGNIDLFNRISQYFSSKTDFNKYKLKAGITKEDVSNLFIVETLNMVFSILEPIYMFNDEPFKCVAWVKDKLKRYEPDYFEFLRSIILTCLTDEGRFENKTNELVLIHDQIRSIDHSSIQEETSIEYGQFEYFTGNKFCSGDKVIEGFIKVRGLSLTKKEIVKDFLKDNKDLVIEQLKSENELLVNTLHPKSVKNDQPTTVHFALLHYYLQEGKYEPRFKKENGKTKRDAIIEQGKRYGVKGDSFTNKYYEVSKKDCRLTKTNALNIKRVIEMLNEYPKAQELAQKELKDIELLP